MGGGNQVLCFWMSHSSGDAKRADGEGWALYKGTRKYLLTVSPGQFNSMNDWMLPFLSERNSQKKFEKSVINVK